MLILLLLSSIVAAMSIVSVVHALGILSLIMMSHGFLVNTFGDALIRLPLICGAIVLVSVLYRGRWRTRKDSGFMILLWLSLSILVSAQFGLDPERSFRVLPLYLKAFAFALLVGGTVRNQDEMRSLTLYLIAGATLGAMLAAYQYATNTYVINNIYAQRAGGLSSDPNDTAMLLVAAIPLVAYWIAKSNSNFLKAGFLVTAVLIVFAIVLTGSRGGFVALTLVAAFYFFRKPSFKKIVIGVVAIVAVIVFSPQSYKDRMGTLVTGADEVGNSLSLRGTLMRLGFEAYLDDPVIGVGVGNFAKAIVRVGGPSAVSSGALKVGKSEYFTAHNMYLEFFLENGLIGGLFFVALFFRALYQFLKVDKSLIGAREDLYSLGFCMMLTLLSMMICCLFLSQGKNSVLWFVVGMGIAAGNFCSHTSRDKEIFHRQKFDRISTGKY